MSKQNLYLGKTGEDLAVGFLRESGYKIIARNYKTRLGEIDIVAREKGVVCFVEVKTRSSDRFGLPQEAVLRSKQRQISKAALEFLKNNDLLGQSARFDVVSVVLAAEGQKIDLIRNAFELDRSFTY
ncbi:MAG: YraN family protein [Candidatus Omnitrophota bacterium]